MAYFQDVKILVYVKRGVYTQAKVERNAEKYGMLKVLMGTAYREVEPATLKLSPRAKFVWHAEHCMLEIDMPTARWETRYPEVQLIARTLDDLEREHGYVWETAYADLEDHKRSVQRMSRGIQNPILKIKSSVEVMI